MIGRYSLPTDDWLASIPGTVITASAEDSAYPVTNWAFRKPSKPSKLTTDNGSWTFDFLTAVQVVAFALIYHNFDEGLPALLEWSSNNFSTVTGSQAITIPLWTEDAYGTADGTVNPWIEVTGSPAAQYWRLTVGGSPGNSQALSLGRPYFSAALRDLGVLEAYEQDVRWGVQRSEVFNIIEHQTELGADAGVYPLGGKREAFNGELALNDTTAQTFISLARSARGRVYPFLVIPDVTKNQACMVRFQSNFWLNTRETINADVFPYSVRELARGLDWP